MRAEIYITPKKKIADPQGLTVKHALISLGYDCVDDVRIGKLIIVGLKLKNKKEAQKQIDSMCKKLLANLIIEDYKFQVKGE